ncbi:MAG: di-trans,poly-cis-decaprenylcistransferase [Gemmatimonadales bacterium]|nr:di-trans,poly-cis-decaprenylcistransferase [Gemmatimonadales bacterium]
MDGNGRWAKRRNLPRTAGHQAGMASVRECIEGAVEAGVEVLTLFAFSQENWQRPPEEIDALMGLLQEYVSKESAELKERGVSVKVLGELDRLTPAARAAVASIESQTAEGNALTLNICLSYGSRAELARAARLIATEVRDGTMRVEEIDEAAMARRLYTAGTPDPDLLIRTSGEHRLSNFLLWQIAYAEFHVTAVLWPDFTRRHLFEAILDFQRRDRRFGRVTAGS